MPVVRGESARKEFEHLMKRWRAAVIIQKHFRQQIGWKTFDEEQKSIILLQSVIRGCLARRNFTRLQNHESIKNSESERGVDRQLHEMKTSLAAARKSLPADDALGYHGKSDASPLGNCYDSEDTLSVETRIPEGTPLKMLDFPSDATQTRDMNGACNALGRVTKEFEQRKQVFDDDAAFLVEVKSGQSASSMNPDEELPRLKLRFSTWKKEYKVRLRETKAALHKLGNNPESEKNKRKWWGKRSMRGT